MANYYATIRTNYFRVTDEEKYEWLFSGLCGECEVLDFTFEKDGVIWHGFGSYSSIGWINPDTEDADYDFDEFCTLLSEIMPEDEAFIYTEVGNEKLRYISGFSVIVTKKDIQVIDLISRSIDKAREMLGNPEWKTKESW